MTTTALFPLGHERFNLATHEPALMSSITIDLSTPGEVCTDARATSVDCRLLALIVDLDRPQRGLVLVNQRPLVALQQEWASSAR